MPDPRSADIEVTSEMENAGLRVLDFGRDAYEERYLVAQIYIAMENARLQKDRRDA